MKITIDFYDFDELTRILIKNGYCIMATANKDETKVDLVIKKIEDEGE